MAGRARDFNRANPSTNASFASVMGQLDGCIIKLDGLLKQEQDGVTASRASTARREELRRWIHHGLLKHLVTVADLAATEVPGLDERYDMPASNAPNEKFRSLARRMLEQGEAQQELLLKHGLSDTLLPDLAAALDEFDASVAESNEGRRGHVGARAELKAVSDEVMLLVGMLDGLNRYRFEGNAELLAAWESARKVVGGPRSPAVPAEGGTPPGGEVGAAA